MLKKAAYHTLALRTSFMLFAFTLIAFQVSAQSSNDGEAETDSSAINLPFPFGGEDQFNPIESPAGFDFAWPSNFTYEIVLD